MKGILVITISLAIIGASFATKPKSDQVIPVIFRDFLAWNYVGSVISPPAGALPLHLDFNHIKGDDPNIVTSTLGTDGLPVYAPTTSSLTTNGVTWFDAWWRPSVYGREVDSTITLTYDAGNSSYSHPSFRNFFPLNGIGWGDQLADPNGGLHNFGFTMQLSHHFYYTGDEFLKVGDDDDIFVYINGQLKVNNGGIHLVEPGTVDFTGLGLSVGDKVLVDIFYAERHTPWATLDISTNIYFGGFAGGGDPHFNGLSDEKYDVMGEPNQWFEIFSDVNFQLNAYFVQGCTSKPDVTAMGAVAMIIGDSKIHLDITCNATLDETTDLLRVGSITPIGPNGIYGTIAHILPQVYIIETPDYQIRVNPFIIDPSYQKPGMPFHGDDCIKGYFNFDIELKNAERNPHGLLGQTAHHVHSDTAALGKSFKQGEGEIEGVYTDYIVSSMYGTNSKFNRYSFDSSAPAYVAPKKSKRSADPFVASEHTYWELVQFMESQCPKV